jgi:hypothetical protein
MGIWIRLLLRDGLGRVLLVGVYGLVEFFYFGRYFIEDFVLVGLDVVGIFLVLV